MFTIKPSGSVPAELILLESVVPAAAQFEAGRGGRSPAQRATVETTTWITGMSRFFPVIRDSLSCYDNAVSLY